MANLIKVNLLKLDSRTFNEEVILNTNRIKDVYLENGSNIIIYDYQESDKKLTVQETVSDLNNAIGVYISNVRLTDLSVKSINGTR